MKTTCIFFSILMATILTGHAQTMQMVYSLRQEDTATKANETKRYILKKQAKNADFNYAQLHNLDKNLTEDKDSLFAPIKGKFNYFQFIATYRGLSFNEETKTFHDILIVKTGAENKILDAFQYTLEWAEIPLEHDLYQSSAKNVFLTDRLPIQQLKFKRAKNYHRVELLKEKGIIQLK